MNRCKSKYPIFREQMNETENPTIAEEIQRVFAGTDRKPTTICAQNYPNENEIPNDAPIEWDDRPVINLIG